MGEGSTFLFEIMAELADDSEIQGSSGRIHVVGLEPDSMTPTVVVADDVEANRAVLGSLLEICRVQVEMAKNGQEAVEAFQRVKPDLIFMYVRMPVMDGLEATQEIRKLEGGDTIPIVAVSASVFKDDEGSVLEGGMDSFVRKPFRADEIFEVLEEATGVRFRREVLTFAPEKEDQKAEAIDLSPLGSEILKELRTAIESMDLDAALEIIDRVQDRAPKGIWALAALLNDFDYDGALAIVESAIPPEA